VSLIVSDRVVETSTSTGTGDFALAGAVTGYRRFSAKMSVGDTCYYTIEGINGSGTPTGEWETGYGTYSAANTLTRTTVKDSSNSGSAVTFSAGTKRVFLNLIAASGSIPWYWNPPKASLFTLSNGGGATNMVLTDDVNEGLIMEPGTFASAGNLSNSFALITLASKTADWTMTGRFEGWPNCSFEYNGMGFCLYDSITGGFINHEYQRTYGNINSMSVDKWVNASSFSSTPTSQGGQPRWIQVVHTGGNYIFKFSLTGKRWQTLYSESATAFLTNRADKVGFHMGCARNTGINWQYTCQNFSLV
jgi:hypothetical protein